MTSRASDFPISTSLAMVPYSGKSHETPKASPVGSLKSRLYRSLPSDIFLSIPREALLSHEALLKMKFTSHHPDNNLELRIQRNPDPDAASHCLIEVLDPRAGDLKRCQHVFIKFLLFSNKAASLDELAAPSFSGWEAMQMVWTLKKLTGPSIVIFGDGSTQLPCHSACTEDAMTSLRSMYILKSGQSWYEKQGATCNPLTAYQALIEPDIEEEYLEKLNDGNNAFGTDSPLDYHSFRHHSFTLLKNHFVTPEAYRSAKTFLHGLSIEVIEKVFNNLIDSSNARDALVILEKAQKLIAGEGRRIHTLGDVLDSLEKIHRGRGIDPLTKEAAHRLLHDFRDVFVSHHKSFFLPQALTHLKEQRLSPFAIATACQIIGKSKLNFPHEIAALQEEIQEKEKALKVPRALHLTLCERCYLESEHERADLISQIEEGEKDLQELTQKLSQFQKYSGQLSSIVYDLIFESEDSQEVLRDLYDRDTDSVLSNVKKQTGPSAIKIVDNATLSQLRRGLVYDNQMGDTDNHVEALLPAVNWLSSLTLVELHELIPNFIEHHQHRFPLLLDLSKDSTIKHLLRQLKEETSKENAQNLLGSMLSCLKRPFSDSTVSLLGAYQRNSEVFSSREVYELWTIAKLTIDQSKIFGLR